MPRRRVVLAAALLAACESPFAFGTPARDIRIAPDSAAVEAGDSLRLTATVTDSAGRPLSRPVYWLSSADTIATVSASGLLVARLPGSVTITASLDGVTGRIPVHVDPRIAAVRVDQGDVIAAVGGTLAFTSSARDPQGNVLLGRPVTWSSADSSIVAISASGVAQALSSGTTTVAATRGALHYLATVTVRTLRFARLSAGPADHTCGITDDSVTVCWGANDLGQLGVPALPQSATPVASARGPAFVIVAAGATFSCGARDQGSVYCWGSSARGRLGAGASQLSTARPTPVAGNPLLFGLVSGWNHSCGLAGGAVVCWGENPEAGGTGVVSWTPGVVSSESTFVSLLASVGFGCGLTTGGSALCWGDNGSGQLGNGTVGATAEPTPVAGGFHFVALAAGRSHGCGLTAVGTVACWGDGSAGQLGTGDTSSHLTPVPVSTSIRFVGIAAGGSRTCGLAADGTASCWGDGALTPTAVGGAPAFTALTVGDQHACGLAAGGRAYCWGRNNRGQLGDGTYVDRAVPTPVLGQP